MFSYRDGRLERWLARPIVGVVAADVDVARSHYRLILDAFGGSAKVGQFEHVWHPEDLVGMDQGCLVTLRGTSEGARAALDAGKWPTLARPPESRKLYDRAASLRWVSFELWAHDFSYDTVGFYMEEKT